MICAVRFYARLYTLRVTGRALYETEKGMGCERGVSKLALTHPNPLLLNFLLEEIQFFLQVEEQYRDGNQYQLESSVQ